MVSAATPARHRAHCSIQFPWLIIFALGSGRGVYAFPQARETCVGLHLKVREHLPIASFDLGKTFIGSHKHCPDKLARSARRRTRRGTQLR
jgi:hypothetical protein